MGNRSNTSMTILEDCAVFSKCSWLSLTRPQETFFPHPQIAGQSKSQEALFLEQGRIQQKVDSAVVL